MMRFELLWGAWRRIWDWPLELKHLWFLETACTHRRLSPWTDLQPLRSFVSRKELAIKGCIGLLCVCAHHTLELSLFLTEGMILERPFCNDCRVISLVRLRSARLCGKGEYCLLSMFIKITVVCSATQYCGSQENPEEWQLTFTRRSTKAPDQLQN